MGKVKKNLGIGMLITAACFLFNPNVVIIDILPDFIGYIFLISGIYQLSDINYYFEESLKLFKRMLVVSLIQFFSIFLVMGILPTREISSALMLLAFTFGALELLLLIPGFKYFFDGFIYLGSRHESKAIFYVKPQMPKAQKESKASNKKPKEKKPPLNATSRISLITTVFIILKPILTFAPEILSMFDTSIDPNIVFNYSQFVEEFRVIAIAFLLPVGIFWLISFINYVKSIINDKPFINELTRKYEVEVLPKSYLFKQRFIKLAFIILSVAMVFNVDFYIDNASVLPDFIAPLIVLIMLGIVKKFDKAPIISYIFTIGYMAVSAFTYCLNVYFYSEYTLTLTQISAAAYDTFMLLTASKIVDSVLFVGMILSLLPILSRIIMENTGFAPITAANYNAEEKVKYIHDSLKKKLTVISVLTVLAGISSICYIIFLRSFMYMWIVEFVIYVALSAYFISALNTIEEEIEYKYMLY
jgi:hypothetical protein